MTILTISIDGERVSLHGTTKGDPTQRAAVTRPWVWSRTAAAWVLPRSLRPETRDAAVRRTQRALQDAGLVVEVEDTGHRLTVAEEREARTERLEQRADRHEHAAVRQEQVADAEYEKSRRLVEHIPFGQPILVGHYSERGHRRTLERSQNAMFRSVEAQRAADLAEQRAENLRRALERGTPMTTLRNRIERLEADVRRYTKKIDGTGRPIHGDDKPATGGYRERLLALRARAEEELELDRAELAAREEKGVKVWRPADFKPGDRVRYRFGVREVVRVNPKTLSVRTEYSWLDKLPYQEVTGRISAEEWGAAADEATVEPASGAQALAAIVEDLAQPETCTCGAATPNAVGMETHLRDEHGMDGTAYPAAPGHDVVPSDGDSLALQTTCQALGCGERAYWRLGTAVWDHVPEDVQGSRT